MKLPPDAFHLGVARYGQGANLSEQSSCPYGMYYQIGEEYTALCRENAGRGLLCADTGGLSQGTGWKRNESGKGTHCSLDFRLPGVATQKEDFRNIFQNESVDFTFRNKDYHVEFAGADIYHRGLQPFTDYRI